MDAIEQVKARGLSIISWTMDKATFDGLDVTMYAVSIDDVANGNEPSEEQKRFCTWCDSPMQAAAFYIKRNPDHFSEMKTPPPYTNRWGTKPGPNFRRCQANTKKGAQCRRSAERREDYCSIHLAVEKKRKP